MKPSDLANLFLNVLVPCLKNEFGNSWPDRIQEWCPAPKPALKRNLGLTSEQAKQILGYGKTAADWFEGLVEKAVQMQAIT